MTHLMREMGGIHVCAGIPLQLILSAFESKTLQFEIHYFQNFFY